MSHSKNNTPIEFDMQILNNILRKNEARRLLLFAVLIIGLMAANAQSVTETSDGVIQLGSVVQCDEMYSGAGNWFSFCIESDSIVQGCFVQYDVFVNYQPIPYRRSGDTLWLTS